MKKKEVTKIKLQEFKIDQLPNSCTLIIIGNPGSGKSTFIENVCFYNKNKYPVMKAFVGTQSGYRRMCKIANPLYVLHTYDEKEEERHILRQKKCEQKNGKDHAANLAINILDDITDDPKILKSKQITGIFKLGSQHFGQIFMLGMQGPMDLPPGTRKAASYIVMFYEPEENERKKLFNNYGGLAGSYENFKDLMDQCTGDYKCLIFKKRGVTTNKIEDNIFWYRTKIMPKKWKFGCDEYREYGNKRYNKSYKEYDA